MKSKNKEVQNPTEEQDFKGFTLDELRYQRALLMVKREFLKEKAIHQGQQLKERIPVLNGKSALASISSKGIIGKIAKGLNYTDYLLLGFSIFGAAKKVFSLFKKKK